MSTARVAHNAGGYRSVLDRSRRQYARPAASRHAVARRRSGRVGAGGTGAFTVAVRIIKRSICTGHNSALFFVEFLKLCFLSNCVIIFTEFNISKLVGHLSAANCMPVRNIEYGGDICYANLRACNNISNIKENCHES